LIDPGILGPYHPLILENVRLLTANPSAYSNHADLHADLIDEDHHDILN
jgi:hypothetical protein